MEDRPVDEPAHMPPLELAEWTREDGGAHAQDTIVVLPVGSLEQHGPHLPAGTDALIAEHVAREATRLVVRDTPVAVAPVLSYGCSQHHLPFGVTASLRTETYLAVLRDLLGSLAESGFRKLFVLNGHGGNHEAVRIAVRDIGLERSVHLVAASYFDLARGEFEAAGVLDVGEVPGHAGAFETSLLLAILPASVRWERLPEPAPSSVGDPSPRERPYRYVAPGPFRGGRGFSDDPSRGSGELGRRLVHACVLAAARSLQEFSASTSSGSL